MISVTGLKKSVAMKKLYFLPLILLASCSPKIVYIGNDLGASEQVDVYVNEDYIQRPFVVMGVLKEDLNYTWAGKNYDEVIAKKAIAKAKQCGADAILFSNYYSKYFSPEIQRESRTVSTDSSMNQNSSTRFIASPMSTGRQILFLKYK